MDLAYNRRCSAWGNLTWPKVGEFNLASGVKTEAAKSPKQRRSFKQLPRGADQSWIQKALRQGCGVGEAMAGGKLSVAIQRAKEEQLHCSCSCREFRLRHIRLDGTRNKIEILFLQ